VPTTADYVSLATFSTLASGETYTALVSVRRAPDAPTIRIDANGVLSPVISTTTWTNVFVTFESNALSSTPTYERDYIRIVPQTNASGRVSVDGLQVVLGTSAGAYFDGATSAAGDFTYAWSGTANQSTSLQRGLSVTSSADAGVDGGTGVRSQTQYRTGTSSTIVNAPKQDSGVVTSFISSLTPSFPHTASAWVQGESGKTVYLRLEEFTSADSLVGATNGTAVTMTGSWQRVSVTRSFGSTGTKAKISVLNGSSTTQVFYYDNLMLEQAPSLQDYFDGTDTTSDADLTIVWTGTANASTSAFRGTGASSYAGYNGGAVVSATTQKLGGLRSAKVYYSASSSALDNGLTLNRSLAASTTYTASAWVFVPTGTSLPRFAARGAGFTEVTGTAATSFNTWQRISVTFTTTDAQNYDILLLNSSTAAIDTFFYVDQMLVENSPILRDYFDGTSTSPVSDIPYSWSGAANASTSVQTAPALTAFVPTGQGTAFAKTSTSLYIGTSSAYLVALGVDHGMVTEDFMTVDASTAYTASAWVRGESGKQLAISLSEYDSSDALIGTTTSSSVNATGSWQQINISRAFGSTGVQAKVSILNKTAGQHAIYADAVILAQSSYSGIYFDGSFTDAGGSEFAWTGTANASSSTLTTTDVYAENLSLNPSMETVQSGATVLRTNLLTNADMELDPWEDYATGSNVSSSTTEVIDGLLSTKITPTASGVHGAKYSVASVNPGNVYTFSAWALREAGSSSLSAQIQWMSGSTALTLSTQSFTAAPLDTWARLFVTATAPETADSAVVSIVFNNAVATTDIAYIDAALFEQTSQIRDYFSGNTTDALGWDYGWSGDESESTSTASASAVVFRTNLVPNPSFETNTTGWTSVGSSISRTTSQYYIGSACLLVTPTLPTSGVLSPLSTTVASATHTASAWVRGTAGDVLRIQLNERTTSGASLVGSTSVNLTLTGAWQRISASRLFGTTGVTADFSIVNTTSTALFFIDATLLEVSASVGDFFDGSTGATGDAYINSWTGTANLSTSTQSGVKVAQTGFATEANGAAYQSMASNGNKLVRYQIVDGSPATVAGTYLIGSSLVAGRTYTIVATGTSTVTTTMQVVLRPNVASSANQTVLGTVALSAGTTATFRLTGLASLAGTFGSSSGIAFVTTAKLPGGTAFELDNILVTEGLYVDTYFDGSSALSSDYSVEWSGTEHASTSILSTDPVKSWSSVAGASVYRSAQQTKSGAFSGKVVCDGTLALQGIHLHGMPTVSASNIYTASVWVLAEAGKSIQVALQERTATGALVGVTSSSAVTATGSWQRLFVTRTFGSTGVAADIYVYNVNAVSHIMYVDNVLLEVSSSLQDYFDGDTSNAGDFSYTWTATAHESSSYAYGVGVNGVDAGTGRVVIQSVDWSGSGTKSARIIPTGTSSLTNSQRGMIVAGTDVTSDAVLLDRNQTYTILATLRLNASQTGTIDSSRARRIWFSTNGGTSVASASPISTNAAGVYTHSLNITTTSSGVNSVYLGNGTEAGGGDVWWDNVAVIKGTYSGTYFDGSTSSTSDFDYVWNGLDDESTSAITINPVQDWTGTNGAIVYQNSTDIYANSRSGLVACNGTVGLQGVRLIARATVEPSSQYFASAYVKGEAGKLINIELQEWTTAGTYIGSTTSANITATGLWQRVSISRAMGSTGTRANVVISNIASTPHTFYVDSVILEKTSTLRDYFDGSFPAAGDFSFTWNGTPNASTSQYQAPSVNAVTSVGAFTTQSSDWQSTGRHSLRIISTATSANVSHADMTAFITAGLEPGKTYTVMAKAFRAQVGSVAGSLAYQGFVGSTLTQNITTAIPTTTGVHEVKIVFTVANDIEAAYLRVYNNQTVGGADVWVDDFIIVEGEYLGDYFDGDSDSTSGAFPILYQWNGTPHDSTSIRDIGGAIPAGGAAVLSPFGDAERVNSTAALEIKYRSGWLG
jgi:hypothetical protein